MERQYVVALFCYSMYYLLIAWMYYKHKHTQLKQAIENIGEGAILLDLHSFNPAPLACDIDTRPDRPDICLGFNDDKTKPDDTTLRALKEYFEENGLMVAFNMPFSGAMTANTYTSYKVLMIEINKKCYLDNHILKNDVGKLSDILQGAISRL